MTLKALKDNSAPVRHSSIGAVGAVHKASSAPSVASLIRLAERRTSLWVEKGKKTRALPNRLQQGSDGVGTLQNIACLACDPAGLRCEKIVLFSKPFFAVPAGPEPVSAGFNGDSVEIR